jgi:hypothetical protein
LHTIDVMYGSAGRGFGDRKDGAVVLLRKLMGS